MALRRFSQHIEELIAREVEQAPPLTDRQRATIRAAFTPPKPLRKAGKTAA